MAAAGLGAPRGGDEEVTEAGDRNDPVDVMKVLVEKGANVNAANDAGMTPMHYAVQRGVDRIIEYLASKGARFDIKNKQGRTPADLARGPHRGADHQARTAMSFAGSMQDPAYLSTTRSTTPSTRTSPGRVRGLRCRSSGRIVPR